MITITEKQLKYLNILLTQSFGEFNRKIYLKHFYKVESSKDLSKEKASEIIEKFVDDNPKKYENIAIAMEKIYELIGQRKLF